MQDENKVEVVFNILNLLFLRYREYQALTGDDNLKPNPDKVDKILNPPKPPKRKPKILPDAELVEFKKNEHKDD